MKFFLDTASLKDICLASSDGFVVMPSMSPAWVAQLMSLRLAVSRKNFMTQPRRRGQEDSAPRPGTGPEAGRADLPPGCHGRRAGGGNPTVGAGQVRCPPLRPPGTAPYGAETDQPRS